MFKFWLNNKFIFKEIKRMSKVNLLQGGKYFPNLNLQNVNWKFYTIRLIYNIFNIFSCKFWTPSVEKLQCAAPLRRLSLVLRNKLLIRRQDSRNAVNVKWYFSSFVTIVSNQIAKGSLKNQVGNFPATIFTSGHRLGKTFFFILFF